MSFLSRLVLLVAGRAHYLANRLHAGSGAVRA